MSTTTVEAPKAYRPPPLSEKLSLAMQAEADRRGVSISWLFVDVIERGWEAYKAQRKAGRS